MDHPDLYTLFPDQIIIYTASSCGDCRLVKAIFQQKRVNFMEIILEEDPGAELFVRRLNHGFASVPTIVFPDGSILVEPSMQDLIAKFSNS